MANPEVALNTETRTDGAEDGLALHLIAAGAVHAIARYLVRESPKEPGYGMPDSQSKQITTPSGLLKVRVKEPGDTDVCIGALPGHSLGQYRGEIDAHGGRYEMFDTWQPATDDHQKKPVLLQGYDLVDAPRVLEVGSILAAAALPPMPES